MRFTAAIVVVLITAGMTLAQKPKQPRANVPTAPGLSHSHGAPTPPPVTSSSRSAAAQLAKIEHQTARLGSNKPATHPVGNVKTTPALDLGKNKPVRSGRSPQRTNHNGH